MFDVRAHFGKWILVGAMAAAPVGAEVIFEENFDDQPDWHSAMHSTDRTQFADTHVIPKGWYAIRQDPSWAPSVGHADRHESIEILSSNKDKARSGDKSYVTWRDSYDAGWNRWNSDSILAIYLREGSKTLYVRFWIKFAPNWTGDGSSKLFRISSWDEEGSIFGYGGDRYNAPMAMWSYSSYPNNVRNKLSLRGHPQGTNYFMRNPEPVGLPRSISSGDLSIGFDKDIRDLDGDGEQDNEVTLTSKVSGDVVSGTVGHKEIYGDDWNQVEFYVQMNTGPGRMDGVLKQWLNGQLVFSNERLPWMGLESSGGREWNVVAFGGNDFFRSYDNSLRVEEWYAIDDIVVRSDLPNGSGLVNPPPMPPNNVYIK